MQPAIRSDPYGINLAVEEAARPPKPLYKFKSFWLVVVVLVLVVAVKIILNVLAANFTQKGLDSIEGYKGTFSSVNVSLFPIAYTIEDLKLIQDGKENDEPAVYVKSVNGRVIMRKLLKGQLVATVSVHQAKFTVLIGETKVPSEAKEAADEGAKKTKQNNLDIGSILEKVIPLRADRIEVRDSEINIVDPSERKMPEFWVSDLQIAIENLVTRKELDENVPLALSLRAVVAKTGTLKVLATADLLADKPAFTGEAQLSGLKLESLHEWTAAKAGVAARGTLDTFVNFNSAKGILSGDVKVLIRSPKLSPATDKISDSLKAKMGNLAISVLSDKEEGRDAVGTTLPIKGSLLRPEPQIWPAILGVVRNAFVEGLNWGFEDLPTPTAGKKEGVIEQTVKALDKDGPAPKAQPRGK